MPLYQQTLIQPGPIAAVGPSRVRLTRDDLHHCRENTLALIQGGTHIPVLLGHATVGSVDGGPPLPTGRPGDRSKTDAAPMEQEILQSPAVGQLVDLWELPDGSLAQVIELDGVATGRAAAGRGPPAFTSPEIRPYWNDGFRRRPGPLIVHVALTNKPLCPGQTPLELVQK